MLKNVEARKAIAAGRSQLEQSVILDAQKAAFKSERDRVEHLFQLYEKMTDPLLAKPARTQTAHFQGQGLSKPELPRAPVNRSPRRNRRKMGNRNQGIYQMGTAR